MYPGKGLCTVSVTKPGRTLQKTRPHPFPLNAQTKQKAPRTFNQMNGFFFCNLRGAKEEEGIKRDLFLQEGS